MNCRVFIKHHEGPVTVQSVQCTLLGQLDKWTVAAVDADLENGYGGEEGGGGVKGAEAGGGGGGGKEADDGTGGGGGVGYSGGDEGGGGASKLSSGNFL